MVTHQNRLAGWSDFVIKMHVFNMQIVELSLYE